MFYINFLVLKIRAIARVILIIFIFELFTCVSGQAQVHLSNVFFKLNKNIVVKLSGDLKVSEDVSFINNGIFDINSTRTSNIIFSTKESNLSQGLMQISGDTPITINLVGDGSGVQNLLLNNDLKILSNLNVYSSLQLEDCIVNSANEGACLSLKSGEVDSFTSTNSRIEGTFSRMLNKGESNYIFPVGDEYNINDVYLNEIQLSQEARVSFMPTVYALDIEAYKRLVDYKWRIQTSKDNDESFSVKFDVANLVDRDSYTSCMIAFSSEEDHCYKCLRKGDEFKYPYLYSSEKVGSGDYNIVTLVDDAYSKVKLVNAILLGGGNESKLVMESPIGVVYGKVTVFNQIGDVVFSKDKFETGDFDASLYPEGVYYIYMEYSYKDGSESFVLKEFLQILNK